MSESTKVKNILVTGGAGYVGSHCIVNLLEAGYEVVVVDNLVNAWKDPCKQMPESLIRCQILAGKRVKFISLDILNTCALLKVLTENKIDCVIHFAALKSVSESCSQPLDYYENNVGGTVSLLQAMKEAKIYMFIYSSSSTVYGAPQYLPLDEKHPTGQGCTNPYGKSKYFVEEILKDLAASEKGWKIISLRYFNPVGAHSSGRIGEDPRGTPNNLMPFVAQVAIGRRPKVLVYGNDYDTPDGTGVRDYIHISDLATGHVSALGKLLGSDFCGFREYNLGTGRGYSVLEVIRSFEHASGSKIKYEIVGRRDGDIATSYCDASRAKKELGWLAVKNLEDMCKDSWNWQKQNPAGYQKK